MTGIYGRENDRHVLRTVIHNCSVSDGETECSISVHSRWESEGVVLRSGHGIGKLLIDVYDRPLGSLYRVHWLDRKELTVVHGIAFTGGVMRPRKPDDSASRNIISVFGVPPAIRVHSVYSVFVQALNCCQSFAGACVPGYNAAARMATSSIGVEIPRPCCRLSNCANEPTGASSRTRERAPCAKGMWQC